MTNEDDDQHNPGRKEADRFQWIIAAFASVLVIALICYLFYVALTQSGGTPRLALSIDYIDQTRPGYVVVELRNDGNASAADVQIQGALPDGEMGEAAVEYSPARSGSKATLVFSRPVRENEIDLRVKGFSDP